MSWSMILRRIRRDGRVFAILLLAMTLVTAFFALSPFYLRSVAEAALRYTVEHAYPGTFNLTLRNTERTDLAYQPILSEELGGLARSVEQVTYSGGVFCDPPGRICTGDDYRAYLPIGFSQLESRFALTAGRFPQATGDSTVVEAVLTNAVAEKARYAPGDSFRLNGVQVPTITVQIVGLVDPVTLEDPFWDALTFVTLGQITDVTSDLQRFDFGVIIPESDYDTAIAPVVRSGTVYDWVIEIEPLALRAGSLEALAASLERTEARFRQVYPDVSLNGGLRGLIADFQFKIAAAERPVILLSGAVLLLMIYQLMTTTARSSSKGSKWNGRPSAAAAAVCPNSSSYRRERSGCWAWSRSVLRCPLRGQSCGCWSASARWRRSSKVRPHAAKGFRRRASG